MESSPDLLSLEFSSSDEECESRPSRFDIAHLPSLKIPSPVQSNSSGCETPTSPTYPASYVSSTPDTPTTPLTPGSSLGGEFSFINIPSQSSDGASATSKTPRRKYVKRKSYPFKKGQPPPRAFHIVDSPHSKKLKVERSKTAMFSDMRFPAPVGSYQIRVDSGNTSTTQELTANE